VIRGRGATAKGECHLKVYVSYRYWHCGLWISGLSDGKCFKMDIGFKSSAYK
jgi:hypothetical protein